MSQSQPDSGPNACMHILVSSLSVLATNGAVPPLRKPINCRREASKAWLSI